MPVNIDMPKLSDTMTEGTLIKWHKKVGDLVEIGDVIAEIETDKATMEMEAFDEGTLLEIRVAEGQKAPIGAVLAVLGDPGETAAGPVTAPAAAAPLAAPAPSTPSAPAVVTQPTVDSPAAPSAERPKSSPLARKVAAELGVDLTALSGSGPGGRIVRADVESAAASGPAAPAPAAPAPAVSTTVQAAAALAATAREKAVAPAPSSAPQPPAPAVSGGAAPPASAIRPVVGEADQRIELTTIRRIIADRLLTSKITIPHFYLHIEVDAAPLMVMRQQINEQAERTHGNKYTINDFILKAVVNAAQAVPAINASFNGDSIIRFANVGLAVAIAIDDGLVTPVIKQAQTKSLLQISREVKDMAARAKERKLKPDEFDGGTITVSNLGAWGIEAFDAIVNPPQAAILAVGAAIEKPVVSKGQIVPGLRMNLGLSVDHRVVDGAVAAQFLAEVRKLIEQPALMLI